MTTDQLDTILLSLQTLHTSRQARFYANLRQWSSQQITDHIADQQALQQAIDNLFAVLHPQIGDGDADVEDPHCPECDASGFEMCSECGHCDECCDCSTQLAEDDGALDSQAELREYDNLLRQSH